MSEIYQDLLQDWQRGTVSKVEVLERDNTGIKYRIVGSEVIASMTWKEMSQMLEARNKSIRRKA